MQEIGVASRLALAIAFAAATPAFAVSFGSAETRSALGEPLDALIPFQLQEGDEVDAACFALVRDRKDGPQMLGEGVLTIERQRGGGSLRIRTIAPILEPAIMLRVRTACAGQNGQVVREYPLLLDPRFEATPASIASPAIAARLTANEGETLEGLAAKVYPRDAEARRRYLGSLRDLNPELAAKGDRETIPAGTPVALADLRGPGPRARARAPATSAAPPPAAPPETTAITETTTSAPGSAAESVESAAPAPLPPRVPRERSERKPAARASTSDKAARPAAARAPRASAATRTPSGFSLKLSSLEMDLAPSKQTDDRTRAQLRERLTILDADDQVAAMLQMRNSLKQLEARVADMQLKLDSLGSLPVRTQAPKAEPIRIDPPTVEAKPEPAKTTAPEPAKAEVPPAVVATPEPAKAETPAVAPAPGGEGPQGRRQRQVVAEGVVPLPVGHLAGEVRHGVDVGEHGRHDAPAAQPSIAAWRGEPDDPAQAGVRLEVHL